MVRNHEVASSILVGSTILCKVEHRNLCIPIHFAKDSVCPGYISGHAFFHIIVVMIAAVCNHEGPISLMFRPITSVMYALTAAV